MPKPEPPSLDSYARWLGLIGGRKFVLTVVVQAVNALLIWHHSLSSESYAIVVCATVGAYLGANAYQAVKAPTP